MSAQAFFLPAPDGQRFCVYHSPQGEVLRGRVIYIHPLAEEMNKSRRMAALQSRSLARAGFAVLQIDLLGCGDSSGDFGDARWDDWVSDVVRANTWLRSQAHPGGASMSAAPLWLWGLRCGCLLALQAEPFLNEACHFLFWQPPPSGKVLLQQFLRLRLAVDMLGGSAKGAMDSMRQTLSQGQPIEVAGYLLGADLAQGLERATLSAPPPRASARRVEWFEVSALAPPRLSPLPPATALLWQHPDMGLVRHALSGASFWQSAEIEEVPALLEATTAALCTGNT